LKDFNDENLSFLRLNKSRSSTNMLDDMIVATRFINDLEGGKTKAISSFS